MWGSVTNKILISDKYKFKDWDRCRCWPLSSAPGASTALAPNQLRLWLTWNTYMSINKSHVVSFRDQNGIYTWVHAFKCLQHIIKIHANWFWCLQKRGACQAYGQNTVSPYTNERYLQICWISVLEQSTGEGQLPAQDGVNLKTLTGN